MNRYVFQAEKVFAAIGVHGGGSVDELDLVGPADAQRLFDGEHLRPTAESNTVRLAERNKRRAKEGETLRRRRPPRGRRRGRRRRRRECAGNPWKSTSTSTWATGDRFRHRRSSYTNLVLAAGLTINYWNSLLERFPFLVRRFFPPAIVVQPPDCFVNKVRLLRKKKRTIVFYCQRKRRVGRRGMSAELFHFIFFSKNPETNNRADQQQ